MTGTKFSADSGGSSLYKKENTMTTFWTVWEKVPREQQLDEGESLLRTISREI